MSKSVVYCVYPLFVSLILRWSSCVILYRVRFRNKVRKFSFLSVPKRNKHSLKQSKVRKVRFYCWRCSAYLWKAVLVVHTLRITFQSRFLLHHFSCCQTKPVCSHVTAVSQAKLVNTPGHCVRDCTD